MAAAAACLPLTLRLLWPPPQPKISLESLASFKLADYICIAMLLYVRASRECSLPAMSGCSGCGPCFCVIAVLEGDNSFVMRRLLRYPPVEDVNMLAQRGVQLQDPSYRPPGQQVPLVMAAYQAQHGGGAGASGAGSGAGGQGAGSGGGGSGQGQQGGLFGDDDSKVFARVCFPVPGPDALGAVSLQQNLFDKPAKSSGSTSKKLDALMGGLSDGLAKLNPFQKKDKDKDKQGAQVKADKYNPQVISHTGQGQVPSLVARVPCQSSSDSCCMPASGQHPLARGAPSQPAQGQGQGQAQPRPLGGSHPQQQQV